MNETLAFYAIHTVPAYPLGEPVDGRPRYGMTPDMARVYRWLVQNRPHFGEFQICFSDLCAALDTERSTAHMHIVGLVERGWLEPTDLNAGHTRYSFVHPVRVFKAPHHG